MDINVLALNLGNTRLAIGPFVEGKLYQVQRVRNDRTDQWNAVIGQVWTNIAGRPGACVVAASVNPTMDLAVEQIVAQATGKSVLWIGKEIPLPIRVLTEEPEQTGVDRVLSVAAAFEQMQKPCAVVDAGTAITVNCCNAQGDFLGGAIFPGLGLMLDSLHRRTAKLPKVDFEIPQGTFGRTTTEAILHGVYHGIRGMVKELIERYATELGAWPDLIATGGDAEALFGGWELVHAVAPDLTLYGIGLAYTQHLIKTELED